MSWLARLLVAAALALAAQPAAAQGYAGLGTDAGEGFAEVRPDTPIRFPEDHGPHPDFRIEWWYVTATLEGPDGAPYGLQWTLFRSALAAEGAEDGWAARQFWMAHAAVTSATAHRAAERFARGGVGQAGVTGVPFDAWIDDWRFVSDGTDFAPLTLTARGADFAYDLTLSTSARPVLQGDRGYSVKSELGQASHYFSQPFFEAKGTLVIDGVEIEVSGNAWMDREWSTQPLADSQTGWDWFALRLDQDTALMLYRLRDTETDAFVTGNWLTSDGGSERIPPGALTIEAVGEESVAGRDVPVRWHIRVPGRGIDIRTEPVNAQAWMDLTFDYWEGPIRFSGSHSGVGYLEMTGY
ncbi:MAG: lipocalin-like domain-containing protein [Pseudomonadota bacterium]